MNRREKDAVEDYRCLSVREIQRDGILVAGWRGNWRWSRNGEVRASVGLEVESLTRVRLTYQSRWPDQDKAQQMDYTVDVEWLPCHFGGSRPMFCCPRCDRRVVSLYGGAVFVCRHCHQLNYRCQQGSKRDTLTELSHKLRDELGCDEGMLSIPARCIPKPKGMHWATFERKIARLQRIEGAAIADMNDYLSRTAKRLGMPW
ncbi:hypothetical protein NNO07_06125 [Pseudomonas resinovorans]|uniref:Uncharacterized protein n=1 Tax=Metapseudomonas resinovorans TaxID=53412 RepID=A0ABT4Y1D3_METRE|nr:hypothetical protein [Pseudomonas resinovorans]MDA8482640.1 hypothetical protein [Pseudomonas resinovorans]